jgi:two-component system chemotaxis response regulator CheY
MSKTVLVVDDSPSLRAIIKLTLKCAGYTVIEAVDGVNALSKLDGQKINVIVSDVAMPNMNGIELVKKIKVHPDYKFTPILMLTTEAGETLKAEGKAAGAKPWLVKPFQPPVLLSAISKLV